MKQCEFNFVALKKDIPRTPTMRISIDKTQGMVRFLRDNWCVELTTDLVGKFIKFYHDENKKVLAWKIFDDGSLDQLSEYKQVKRMSQKNGFTIYVCDSNIKKFLSPDKKYLDIETKTWKSTSIFDKGAVYHYIDL